MPTPSVVDALEELRQVGVQPGREDLVDAAVLQVGAQPAGAAQRLAATARWRPARRLRTTSCMQAASERGMSGAQDQQLGHALGPDHVAVDLAVDLEARDRAQDRATSDRSRTPGPSSPWPAPKKSLLQRVELHVEQARRVVGALEEGADAQEVERLVLQHRADGDAARQVRAELDPFEELRPGRARSRRSRSMRLNSSQVWFCVSQTSVVSVPRTARAFSRAAAGSDRMRRRVVLVAAP